MRSDQMLLKTGVSHTARVDLLSYIDFEPIGHMTWKLLSFKAHFYIMKCIKNSYKI